jgi:predicted nuclease with RNAse H fold
MKIIGIDLAISKGKTVLCTLNEEPRVYSIDEDSDIITFIRDFDPSIIAIDAPLSFPEKALRDEERGLHALGIPVFPPNMPGMQKLTARAVELKHRLTSYKVFEVYPYATRKLLGLDLEKNDINDSYVCALTGWLYTRRLTRVIGESLIIPSE